MRTDRGGGGAPGEPGGDRSRVVEDSWGARWGPISVVKGLLGSPMGTAFGGEGAPGEPNGTDFGGEGAAREPDEARFLAVEGCSGAW